MPAAAILKNQKAPYFGHGSSAFDKIWPDDMFDLLDRSDH